MSTPTPERHGDARGPSGLPGASERPSPRPGFLSRSRMLLVRARARAGGDRAGRNSDSGAAILETAAVLILAAAIMVAVYQLELSRTFNNAVRQMVCLVEGPECGESWTEEDRPEEPESYDGASGSDNSSENESIAMRMAKDHGWEGQEWSCLDNLWSNVSDFERSTDGDTRGIPGYDPEVHGDHPPPDDFEASASSQISWGLDYISAEHGTPCVAWAQWENSRSY
ncbi:hypothetical protein GCM10007147_15140 [Nocardiopsis kunsanensis]|uniref:Uncharacterized protein n=2 Tax=Nocardiopsis kunsanensis TaxID=141693 RepID=A0A919CGX8_9ACTN|nr:hypothetical protein GCM10007147_15140 [Nocardiopsis kunsanensis]